MDILQPHNRPEAWRIKPETKTLFYRVYLCRFSHQPNVFVDGGTLTAREFEELDSFGGWLSPLRAHEFEEDEDAEQQDISESFTKTTEQKYRTFIEEGRVGFKVGAQTFFIDYQPVEEMDCPDIHSQLEWMKSMLDIALDNLEN